MTNDKKLVTRGGKGHVEGNPFRREDVDYTDVSWTNPVTHGRQVWSIPVEFLVTFFKLDENHHAPEEFLEFEKEREEWLKRAGEEE